MTTEQIENLDRAREFKKTIVEDIQREVNKIPKRYGNGTDETNAESVCNSILLDLRLEMLAAVEGAMSKVYKYIETI